MLVTIPEDMPTVATTELDEYHVPPALALDNVEEAPVHMVVVPVIEAGVGFTVSDVVFRHPLLSE